MGAALLFVRLGEREFIPFLHSNAIKLKDPFSESLMVSEASFPEAVMVKDIEAISEGGNAWFECDYRALRALLEEKSVAVANIKTRVMTGELLRNFEYLAEATLDETV